ncbi:MAG TPA: PHP domain-containing protein [bacterium]|nr:PHP domain-containing protein [bacterium]
MRYQGEEKYSDSSNLQRFAADLHVHTALSPCADDSCTPPNIISAAVRHGIDIIAVTDHNSAENVESMSICAEEPGIKILPGIEVTTKEEVHIVCLFNKIEHALTLQDVIYSSLPDGRNNPDYFGRQLVVNERGETIQENEKMLIGASGISVEDLVEIVHNMDGLAIAAHIDRQAYSLISNLGMVPPDSSLDALEISSGTTRDEAVARFPGIEIFPLVTGSDAHLPEHVGSGPTLFLIEHRIISEIKMALNGIAGREYLIQ